MRQAEKEKKEVLVPNFVDTELGQENSVKNSNKIQQIKKPHSGVIFSQNGIRQAEKERKNIQSRIPFLKFIEKQKKKIKKLNNLFPANIFSQHRMRQAEKQKKKFQSLIPIILGLGKKIPKKIVKKFKKLKNPFPSLFLAKTGLDRMKKR